jgi:hypothetical protein
MSVMTDQGVMVPGVMCGREPRWEPRARTTLDEIVNPGRARDIRGMTSGLTVAAYKGGTGQKLAAGPVLKTAGACPCPIEWRQPVNPGRLRGAGHSDDQHRAGSEAAINSLCKQEMTVRASPGLSFAQLTASGLVSAVSGKWPTCSNRTRSTIRRPFPSGGEVT